MAFFLAPCRLAEKIADSAIALALYGRKARPLAGFHAFFGPFCRKVCSRPKESGRTGRLSE